MRSAPWAALLLCLCAAAAGCGRGPANPEKARDLASWIAGQSYSSWQMFRHRDRAPHEPPSPDGLTLGSPNVFAAIGCNPKDVTALDVFWGDRRTERPIAKSLTVALREGDKERALADFAEQTLKRVRHTSISVAQVEDDGLRVSCVDFAPMRLEDNFLGRWFLVENTSSTARRLSLTLKMNVGGEWARKGRWAWATENLALVSDAALLRAGDAFEARLGRLPPGAKAAAAVLLVAAGDSRRLPAYTDRARAALGRLKALLDETKSDWEKWCARTPLRAGDERVDDLMDGLLCLVRSHVGAEAIHTGSLRYPHNRAWVRDSYWVQRVLWELGRGEEAGLSLDFFHRAWRRSGIASYYEIPSGKSTAYGYVGVELPHYLVLMVADAERLGGVDGAAYWDMVRGCLDRAAVPASGLQPMNGDETWLLAAPVRELDDLLDNSWLLIASAEYGAKVAQRVGDGARAARYGAMAYRARLALTEFQPGTGDPPWYAIGHAADGSLDFSLCPQVLARGVVLGVLPSSDPYLRSGVWESWKRMQFERGVRAHARSATLDGGSPGYVLSAAAEMELPLDRSLLDRLLRFCSATGNVWEFHDLYDPAWGGEKRRLWDSAVVLMGMVHTLFEVRHDGGSVELLHRPLVEPVTEIEQEAPPVFGAADAAHLLAQAGSALILESQSREHAARLARELLRHSNREYGVAPYAGGAPADRSAIIIAPFLPPGEWVARPGYWVRKWEGPPQVWIYNKGDAYLDTDPLLWDLFSYLMPERDKPLPFPDANWDLVARHGEPPSGRAEVAGEAGGRRAVARLPLGGSPVTLRLRNADYRLEAARGEGNLLKLTVIAPARRSESATLTVSFPAGWWLVFARDMTGKWDRVADPVNELRLPGGGIELVYHFRPSEEPLSLTFDLAKLQARSIGIPHRP